MIFPQTPEPLKSETKKAGHLQKKGNKDMLLRFRSLPLDHL